MPLCSNMGAEQQPLISNFDLISKANAFCTTCAERACDIITLIIKKNYHCLSEISACKVLLLVVGAQHLRGLRNT